MKIKKWDGVPIDPATVERWRNEALEFLKEKSNQPYWHCMSGDTMVVGVRYEDAIEIWHTKIVDKAMMVPTTQVVWEDAAFFHD
jgi:hypothetical protein